MAGVTEVSIVDNTSLIDITLYDFQFLTVRHLFSVDAVRLSSTIIKRWSPKVGTSDLRFRTELMALT